VTICAASEAKLPFSLLIAGNGRELRSSSSLHAAVRDAGDRPLTLKLLRGNDQLEVKVKIGPVEPVTSSESAVREGEHRV
jgi:hypothetical protein